MTASDGSSGAGWRHWAPQQNAERIQHLAFEMWPDLREYGPAELTATNFKYRDSSNASLYNTYNAATVDRHVKWMQDYQIDGVFVQRFIGEAIHMRPVRDKVLQNIRTASEKYMAACLPTCMTFPAAIRLPRPTTSKNDWKHLVDDLRITRATACATADCRWCRSGATVSTTGRSNAAQLNELLTQVQIHRAGPIPRHGKTSGLTRTAQPFVLMAERLSQGGGDQPRGRFGRYANESGADNWRASKIAPDLAALKGAGSATCR